MSKNKGFENALKGLRLHPNVNDFSNFLKEIPEVP